MSFLTNFAPREGDLGAGGLVIERMRLDCLDAVASNSLRVLSPFASFGTGGGVPGGGVSGGVSGGGVSGGGGEQGSWERGVVDFSCI